MIEQVTAVRSCLRLVAALSLAILAGCVSSERDELLRVAPKGSSIEQVLNLCQTRGLQCQRSDTAGYLDQDTGKVVGVRSVWATLKTESSSVLPTVSTTSAYWGFDKEGRLLDVWVWHTTDAP